jgi:hypothetical protein
MPARNSDGTIRNARAPKKYTMRSLIARWVEAEIIRRKQMGFSFRAIAEQVEEIARGSAQPFVPFSAGMEFPPNYSVSDRACAKAFSRAVGRAPALAVEDMRRLDTERCEDIYRGLAPGIMRGDPSSGSVAIKALGHKARINGYAAVEEIGQGASGLSIHIHLDDEADAPKPVNELARRTRAIGPTQ